ncbi:MAG: redoxin family protein [Akkermansiaceae bacterium]|nr:redoxin family protein [Akkermansiaceae bacterium]NNM29900.1 redoxin family protein [Akkermansiaceae bacterium]
MHLDPRPSLAALALGLAAILPLPGAPEKAKSPQKPVVKTLAIGAQAPGFDLPGVDGKNHALADFAAARILVVVFTCNHCPDAIGAQDRLKKLAADYGPQGVAVVAISGNDPLALQPWELGWSVYGDSFEEMRAHARDHEYNFPYLYDGDTQAVTTAYGAVATPHVFIFDADRRLRYQGRLDNGRRDPGPATENNARDVLDLLLAGKPVPETMQTSRVFGCSTKWAWKRALAQEKAKEWAGLPVTVEPADAATIRKLAANETGKIRLINVWATDCGPCLAEFPDLVGIYRQYQKRDFDFVTIATDPAPKAGAVRKVLTRQQAALSPLTAKSVAAEGRRTNNYHYDSDDLDALAEALDAEWQGPLPHTLLLAPGGKVIFRHTGRIDPIAVRRAIVARLRAEE